MSEASEKLHHLAEAFEHKFGDLQLLQQALTHRSFANEKKRGTFRDNERMEFLGDAVLSVAISTLLWEHYPSAPEGELSRRRADIVSERGLCKVAIEIRLGESLFLGKGEERSGGRQKPRLLSSALEACFAALYLDGGMPVVMRAAHRLFDSHLQGKEPGQLDYKSRAQEWFQRESGVAPNYELLCTDGPDHAKIFHIAMMLGPQKLSEASGRSKIEAEQTAAEIALKLAMESVK